MYDIIFKVKQEKSRTQKVRIFNIHAHALTRTAILTHLPPPNSESHEAEYDGK